jgi:RNA polymerase sigma-70 factor (ECF subfamily)
MGMPDANQASAPAAIPRDIGSLFRTHAETVHRWAVRLGGPGIDADDVVQEVFLIVQRRLREFRGDGKIETWLYRITERIVMKQRDRSWGRRLLRLFGGQEDDLAELAQRGPVTPLETLERNEATRLVYAALAGLSEKQRRAVILYELEGLSGEEIAELTGTKLATVWVHLHRGREHLQARLRSLGAQGDRP